MMRIHSASAKRLCAICMVVFMSFIGCQGNSQSGDEIISPLIDLISLTQDHDPTGAEDKATTNPPINPPPVEVVLPDQDYYVLTNRQKFVGLPGYIPGVEYDDVAFAIVEQPANGVLLGTAPNVAYVPNPGFVGEDSFVYTATAGGYMLRRRMVLHVDPSYVLPVGIPAPEFGLTNSHTKYANAAFDFGNGPEPYRDAGNGPYTHYVNFNTGSDVGNPFGTHAQPRRTIPSDLPEGSVVELHGDGFNFTLYNIITGNGTADKPVYIRGGSALSKPVFRRPIWVETDYVIIENIEFDCSGMTGSVNASDWILIREKTTPSLRTFHHIAVRHCLLRDQPKRNNSGITAINVFVSNQSELANSSTDLIEHVVVYDVEVRNFAPWNDFSGFEDYGGVIFHANTRHGWVLDCHLHHIHGDGIALSRTSALSEQVPPHQIYIGRNYLHNFKENGIDIKLARNVVFSQNVVHTIRDSDSSIGDAIVIQSRDTTTTWQSCDNIWIIFNEIYDSEKAILHTSTGDPEPGFQSRSYLIGNVIHDIRTIRGTPQQRGIGIFKAPLAQSRIIGNTIYNCEHGIWLAPSNLPHPELATAVVRNNLIANLSERPYLETGAHGRHLLLTPHALVPFVQMDHNLHWEDVGAISISIVGAHGSLISYNSSASLAAAYPQFGDGNVDLPPQLENPDFGVFHPLPGSPCIGAGIVDEAYSLFPTLIGGSIAFYQDGTPMTPGEFNLGALQPR